MPSLLVQVFETLLNSFRMTVLTAYKSKFAQVNDKLLIDLYIG